MKQEKLKSGKIPLIGFLEWTEEDAKELEKMILSDRSEHMAHILSTLDEGSLTKLTETLRKEHKALKLLVPAKLCPCGKHSVKISSEIGVNKEEEKYDTNVGDKTSEHKNLYDKPYIPNFAKHGFMTPESDEEFEVISSFELYEEHSWTLDKRVILLPEIDAEESFKM